MAHVLLVEDNNDLLCFYQDIITDYIKNSTVYKVRDYGEYLKVLETRQSFDLVLSDWVLLSKSTAYDIIEDINFNNRANINNIFIVTGYSCDNNMNKLLSENKIKKIIKKPVNVDTVKNIIKEFLNDTK